jgi:LacI family transcriptional regulator
LKNHPDISTKTKLKVAELAKSLDYEPNANAISLRTNNNHLFGLLVPSMSNSFYNSFISAVEQESRKNGYNIMILQSGDDPLVEIENIKLCKQNRVSGVFICITARTIDMEPFIKLKEHRIPVIFFDKVPNYNECNKVCVADTQAATIAAETLIQTNKKYVLAFFGNKNLSITQKRLLAFEETFKTTSPKVKIEVEFCHSTNEAYQQTLFFLKKKIKPEAIFCMSDEILCGVMKAIQEEKKVIPKDVSVIAISDGFVPKLYFPEITYVETSGYKLGKAAFAKMLYSIEDHHHFEEITVAAKLVKGGSI